MSKKKIVYFEFLLGEPVYDDGTLVKDDPDRVALQYVHMELMEEEVIDEDLPNSL